MAAGTVLVSKYDVSYNITNGTTTVATITAPINVMSSTGLMSGGTVGVHSRPRCSVCNKNLAKRRKRKSGAIYYESKCWSCIRKNSGKSTSNNRTRKTAPFKKTYCEMCNFVPVMSAQLQVDHIDGNRKNNSPDNYQTLCANCHIAKTITNGDHLKIYV